MQNFIMRILQYLREEDITWLRCSYGIKIQSPNFNPIKSVWQYNKMESLVVTWLWIKYKYNDLWSGYWLPYETAYSEVLPSASLFCYRDD